MATYITQTMPFKVARRLKLWAMYPKHSRRRCQPASPLGLSLNGSFGAKNVRHLISTGVHVRQTQRPPLINVHLTSYLGKNPHDYVKAIANREIAWLSHYAIPKASNNLFQTSAAQNSPDAHISLLRRFLSVASYLLPTNADLVA